MTQCSTRLRDHMPHPRSEPCPVSLSEVIGEVGVCGEPWQTRDGTDLRGRCSVE